MKNKLNKALTLCLTLTASAMAFGMGGGLKNQKFKNFVGNYEWVEGEGCSDFLSIELVSDKEATNPELHIRGGAVEHFGERLTIRNVDKGVICREECQKSQIRGNTLTYEEFHDASIANKSYQLDFSVTGDDLHLHLLKNYVAFNRFQMSIEHNCSYRRTR